MSESQTHTTELTSQYLAQVTGDLESNTKEQERIAADIEALQEQLGALQHDHTVLVNMQQALGDARPATKTDTTAAPAVPHQASAAPRQSKPKKAAATGTKKKAPKKTGTGASPAQASTTAAKPTLVDLIRDHLGQQSEPRSAAEICAALTQAHPDRNIKTTVVRTTLENLVAKSHAHRTKQGSSVYYTATAAEKPAAAEPQQEAVAD
ncbi:BlaI/MecI/CopY family transcriptional regulator [Streptomyces sp. NBC_00996]|uniref:BlaI/MecI/CopY family transcriptional regulator n=1 Tax=Streptomyces sp. NBC_00996 TaxID=2903710 RepID=UPI003869C1F8|nr:BlaI/MecI/CopY family transcriptional regulator [Streptomyces sp. NBC_00996]